MRKLAQALGVDAMSLYNHVEGKDDIVGGIVDLVASEIDPPADADDWGPPCARACSPHAEAFLRHPWAAAIWMTTPGTSSDRTRQADAVLRCFREAGFPKELTYHAYHVLQAYALGFTLQELSFPYEPEALEQLAARFLRDFPVAESPTSRSTSSSIRSRAASSSSTEKT